MSCLTQNEFMSVYPKFSEDYSKLVYISAKEKFLSHTGNYQLRFLRWPPKQEEESVLVIDKVKSYPKDTDEFAGLFGYNQDLISCGFIGNSNKYALYCSPFKGQHRPYVIDVESKEIKWLNFLKKD